MRRRYELHNQSGDPLEEARKMQAGNDQHHGSKQNDGCVINAANASTRRDHAKPEHQRGADDGCSWAINLRSRKTPNREHQVAGEKYRVDDQEVNARTNGEGNDHATNPWTASDIRRNRDVRTLRV